MLVWGNSKIDKKITIIDFCLLNSHIEEEVLCKKTQCGFDLCSTDDKSCEDLNSWTMIIRKYTDKLTQMQKLDKFFDSLNECKPSQYISLKKQVCSIRETCQLFQQYMMNTLVKSSKNKNQNKNNNNKQSNKPKPRPCACTGKFSFKCGRYFCTENKSSCITALKSLNDPVYLKHINNC